MGEAPVGEEPVVHCEGVTPTISVGDVADAIDWYTAVLGFEEAWRWGEPATHASISLDGVVIHLSGTEPSPGGSWLYFVVSDVDALHSRLASHGVEIGHPPEDQEWDMREMPIRDLVGNHLTFATPRIAREPKIPIERQGVDVRLEKRLLAVMRDLADRKGFDLSELLEETLLHTFEPMPGGAVASPHTAADLAYIAELKQKHGIDYGVHASYRFSERSETPSD